MSSTGRSDYREQERHQDDFYITPRWAIREFLREWDIDTGVPSMLARNPAAMVLDPCVGGSTNEHMIQLLMDEDDQRIKNEALGIKDRKPFTQKHWDRIHTHDWTLMPYEDVLLRECNIRPTTMDIREEAPLVDIHGDFLTSSILTNDGYDLIISNPPFNLIHPFILRALQLLRPNGYLVFLLRLNYFGTQKRSEWFKDLMPESTYVHARRMSFDPVTRGTDSVEYAHAIWRKPINGLYPKFTSMRIIPYGKDTEF